MTIMNGSEKFIVVAEITRRAFEATKESHEDDYFCDCEDIYVALVVTYGDEELAYKLFDSIICEVADVVKKTHPSYRMRQAEGNTHHGFFIW